ncbi:hypothetical protein [Nostoc piscinale]
MFIQVPPSCGCGDSSKVTIESFITTQKAYSVSWLSTVQVDKEKRLEARG